MSMAMRHLLSNGQLAKPLLLTVSRLAPEKNVGFLADMLDQLPDVCLAIVGDGPQRAELEQRFAGKNAHFAGYLRGTALAEAYASADAFVYASETETMGNVVLEAMACGCPVIAPRAGGIPSLIEDGVTGLLFEPCDLDNTVRAARRLLGDVRFRNRVGQAARRAVETWDWEHSIARVRSVYRAAIQEFQPQVSPMTIPQRLAQLTTDVLVRGFWILSKSRSKALAGGATTAARRFHADLPQIYGLRDATARSAFQEELQAVLKADADTLQVKAGDDPTVHFGRGRRRRAV
jgi:hypothetical protein